MSESVGSGIFITKGSSLRLSDLTFSVGPGGELQGSPITLELSYDLWPLWLRIAIQHEAMAAEARSQLEEFPGEHDERHAAALEAETSTGMVAIAAAAFSIDAFYGATKARIEDLRPTGTGTARYAVVAETLRRGFEMTEKGFTTLRESLKEMFKFRDLSVHPDGGFRGAVVHPVMRAGVAVPHVAFRVENAKAVVGLAISIVEQCSVVPKERHKALVEWCLGISEKISELKALRRSAF